MLGAPGVMGSSETRRGGAVDVALDDVAAERGAGGSGQLEVDRGALAEVGEGGAGQRLGGEIGGEARREGVGLDVERGEADAVDGDAVARVELGGERGRGDGDAGVAFAAGEGEQGAGGLDQSGEHRVSNRSRYRVTGSEATAQLGQAADQG